MAYSWFSHCEKYLKSLEYEKRFMKKQKVSDPQPTQLSTIMLCNDWSLKPSLVETSPDKRHIPIQAIPKACMMGLLIDDSSPLAWLQHQ